MAAYPQLGTGATSQFPIVKRRRARTVVNTAADGSSIRLADAAGTAIEWQLEYRGLSDAELAALQAFFTAQEGSLNAFTFLDPTANLLAWTEELNQTVWTAGPLLALSGSVADPLGGTAGWRLTNSGGGAQSLTQTVNAPGGSVYCFSTYVKASGATTVTLLAGGLRADKRAAAGWTRVSVAMASDAAATSIVFGIEIPAGSVVDTFGPQAEAQPAASGYKTGDTGGVYEAARFRDDLFTYTTTGVNRHSATVNIVYANHL